MSSNSSLRPGKEADGFIEAWLGLPETQRLSPVLREAFRAVPRHLFVGRYRLPDEAAWRDIGEGELTEHLARLYHDEVVVLVDDGPELVSTLSQPSFILELVERLELRPGHRVVEIGSGSGWLAAIIAHLVAPGGSVAGVEILPQLVRESRRRLRALGVESVEIHQGDAGLWKSPGAFDRLIATTGFAEVPRGFLELVREGGLALIPVSIAGDGRTSIRLFRKEGDALRSLWAEEGFFVDAAGEKP